RRSHLRTQRTSCSASSCMRELWTTVALTSGARIYGLLASVIIVSLTARLLGPDGRGQLAVISSWATIFATCAHLSLGQVAIHLAAERKDQNWLADALPILVLWCVIGSIIAWAAIFVLYTVTDGKPFGGVDRTALVLGLLTVPLLVWEQYGTSLLV